MLKFRGSFPKTMLLKQTVKKYEVHIKLCPSQLLIPKHLEKKTTTTTTTFVQVGLAIIFCNYNLQC